jgi:hypothetical protein
MFFKTASECEELGKFLGLDAQPRENHLERPGASSELVRVSFANRIRSSYALAQSFVSWFGTFSSGMLWITEYGIWPSSENLHLYYKLRAAFHDHRLLHEAPGHLFLGHEKADLVTFVDLAIQFGWGALLFGAQADRRLVISHDEWLLVDSDVHVADVIADAERLELAYEQLQGPRALDA